MYPIDIHVVDDEDRCIVFLPESFNLFYVAKDLGAILKFYENISKDLRLIAEKFNIDETYIAELLSFISEKSTPNSTSNINWTHGEPRSLCLIISQDCNLRCGYCYAEHGIYGREKRLMDINTAKKSINKILGRDYINTILFFGGEPFLNYALMREIVSYIENLQLDVKYTAVTNGTIMNEDIKYFINKNFFNLCISLDEIKEINDHQRHGNVESVHDCVVNTIKELQERKCLVSLKSITTKIGVARLMEIDSYLRSLDIDLLAIESVSDVPENSEFYISNEDYIKFVHSLSNILRKNIQELAQGETRILPFYISTILKYMLTKTRKINMCSAGREYFAITADGDVYPCHRLIGFEEFFMGNVHDENFPGENFSKIRHTFCSENVYSSKKCKTCWARFLCGGDCQADSYISTKDISCPTERRCVLIKTIIDKLLPDVANIFSDELKTNNLLNSLKVNR